LHNKHFFVHVRPVRGKMLQTPMTTRKLRNEQRSDTPEKKSSQRHDNEAIAADRDAASSQFRLVRLLGVGMYSAVFAVESLETRRQYALKCYRFRTTDDGVQTNLLKEMSVAAVMQDNDHTDQRSALVSTHFVRQSASEAFGFQDLFCLSLDDVLVYLAHGAVARSGEGTSCSVADSQEAILRYWTEASSGVPLEGLATLDEDAAHGDRGGGDVVLTFQQEPASGWFQKSRVAGTVQKPPAVPTSSSTSTSHPLLERLHLLQTYIDPLTESDGTVRRLPVAVTLTWFQQCLQGQKQLNHFGWSHGDLKPANILLNAARRRVYLIDFNVSQTLTHGLDRLEYPTWCFAPLEFFQNQPTTPLYAHASDSWTAGCLLLLLVVTQQPMLLSAAALQRLKTTTNKKRERNNMLLEYWRSVGVFPTPSLSRLEAAFPELRKLPSVVTQLLTHLLHPDPLRRSNVHRACDILQNALCPAPTQSLVLFADGKESALRAAATSLSLRPFEEHASAEVRFNPEWLRFCVRYLRESVLGSSVKQCLAKLDERAQRMRQDIMRSAINDGQLDWLVVVPDESDQRELVIVAMHFFDRSLAASVASCGSEAEGTLLATDADRTRWLRRMKVALLLSERLVFNTSFPLKKRATLLRTPIETLVAEMLHFVQLQDGLVYPPSLYGIMRFLIEAQFGLCRPYPAVASRQLSEQRSQDAMVVLEALHFDVSLYERSHQEPISLCAAAWWVCYEHWRRQHETLKQQQQLAWDGRLRASLVQWMVEHRLIESSLDVSPGALVTLASEYILPTLWNLVEVGALPTILDTRIRVLLTAGDSAVSVAEDPDPNLQESQRDSKHPLRDPSLPLLPLLAPVPAAAVRLLLQRPAALPPNDPVQPQAGPTPPARPPPQHPSTKTWLGDSDQTHNRQ
jgi:serine/threonine protein kinase